MKENHWKKVDFDAVKAFKKSKESGIEGQGFKSPADFIKSLGKVASRSS